MNCRVNTRDSYTRIQHARRVQTRRSTRALSGGRLIADGVQTSCRIASDLSLPADPFRPVRRRRAAYNETPPSSVRQRARVCVLRACEWAHRRDGVYTHTGGVWSTSPVRTVGTNNNKQCNGLAEINFSVLFSRLLDSRCSDSLRASRTHTSVFFFFSLARVV